MVYLPLLFRKMKDLDYIWEDLAGLMGMEEDALIRKTKGTEDFSIKEIDKIVSILNLSPAEANEIFF